MQRLPIPRLRGRGHPAVPVSPASPDAVAQPQAGAGTDCARHDPIVAAESASFEGRGPVDAEYAFGRVELRALAETLAFELGTSAGRIATPEELRAAIASAIGERLGGGSVDVRRMPGALQTPESWHVSLDGVPPTGRQAMDELVREALGVR